MRVRRIIGIIWCGLSAWSALLSAQNHFGTVTLQPDIQNVVNQISLDTLQKHLKILTGELPVPRPGFPLSIPNRLAGSAEYILAAEYVRDVLTQYGISTVFENDAPPYVTMNVIGNQQGSRNAHIIVCAHLDAASVNCPGADDNASGVAAMLEVARVLKNYTFEYSIRYIAFGGEERGLLGSAAYANSHSNDSIHAVLNADMIMWDGDLDQRVQIHARPNIAAMYSADLASYVESTGNVYNLPLLFNIVNQGLGASDHASFWNIGRSAVLVIEEYGNDFNPYYHTWQDKWSLLNGANHQSYFHSVSRLIGASAAHLANLLHSVPVEFQSFTATWAGPSVQLAWSTASEKGNAGFVVERSVGAEDFTPLGFVSATEKCDAGCAYSYVDAYPVMPSRYRLKQVDVDGSFAYSSVVEVTAALPTLLTLEVNYPNPAVDRTVVEYGLSSEASVTLDLGRSFLQCLQDLEKHLLPG